LAIVRSLQQLAVIDDAGRDFDLEVAIADDAADLVPLDRRRAHVVGLVRQGAPIDRLDLADDAVAVAYHDRVGLLRA
jgi:hypothetical protein